MPSKERALVTFVVRRVEAFPCVCAIDEPRLLLHPSSWWKLSLHKKVNPQSLVLSDPLAKADRPQPNNQKFE